MHKSIQDRVKVCKITKTQAFIPVILFLAKKMVKKGFGENEGLGLAWDCMDVRQIALYITTFLVHLMI